MEKFKDARIDAMQKEIERLEMVVCWYDNFSQYILESNSNLYNYACEHADFLEGKDDDD